MEWAFNESGTTEHLSQSAVPNGGSKWLSMVTVPDGSLPLACRPTSSERFDSILGHEYRGEDASLSWDFYRRERSNSSEELEQVLGEVQDKRGIRHFEVVAEDEETRITLTGGDDGCRIDYEASERRLGDTLRKVRAIEGVFREHRRWTTYLPNWPAALRRPAIAVGQPTFTLRLSRDEIIQGVITRWISSLLTGMTSFGLGLVIGWRLL